MTRKEAIDTIFNIGKTIAEKQRLTEVDTREPHDGIWKGMYDNLKKQYGESFQTIIFHDGKVSDIDHRKNRYVEITYRIAAPKVSVFGRDNKGYQTLAEIEVSDTVFNDETHKWEGSGDYRYKESQVWGWEGVEMLETLLSMWKERGGE